MYLLIHDSELPVIDGKRNQQARNSYYLSYYLKFLKHSHLVKAIYLRLWRLTTYDIGDRKNNDPDRIHEMPVPRDHLDVFVMRFFQVTSQAQEQDQPQQRQPHYNVSGMQANQRIESGAEQVSADRQVMDGDQPFPLKSRPAKEDRSQEDRYHPPELKSAAVLLPQSTFGKHDRQAAPEQTDCR